MTSLPNAARDRQSEISSDEISRYIGDDHTDEPMLLRRFQLWQGNHYFFLDGRIMAGSSFPIFVGTCVVITAPFLAFVISLYVNFKNRNCAPSCARPDTEPSPLPSPPFLAQSPTLRRMGGNHRPSPLCGNNVQSLIGLLCRARDLARQLVTSQARNARGNAAPERRHARRRSLQILRCVV